MVLDWYVTVDELNLKKTRNIDNTRKVTYNCGGYALETYSWYLPYPKEKRGHYYQMVRRSIRLTLVYTSRWILKEIPNIRLIKNLKQLQSDEYAIAYRIGLSDFHFMKREDDGTWTNKMGGLDKIDTVTEEEVFGKSWNDGTYNSDIILFAKKKG